MDQHKVNRLSVDGAKNQRRTFFKNALSISGAATLTALTGVTVPEIASAHSLKSHIQLPPFSNLTLLYRLFSPRTGDHFYTINRDEADKAVNSYGYNDEGSACFVLSQSFNATVPLYRLYSPRTGDHFYTTNQDEADKAASSFGYNYEGIACYVLHNRRNVSFALPLYRLYNSHSGDHFYTTSTAERDSAAQGGYTKEGVACYVL
jgi:hypothetical protein